MTTTTKITTDLEPFYNEVVKDRMLQERLKASTDLDSLSELAVELGKEKGYSFTKEDVLVAMAIEAALLGELDEVDLVWLLDMVASWDSSRYDGCILVDPNS